MLVTVGYVGRPHGIGGDVVIDLRTDAPERRFEAGATLSAEPAMADSLTVLRSRWHSGRLLVRFSGVDDRDGAERLRGVRLLADVDPDERPDDPEEYYDHQLVGLTVHTLGGDRVGEVTGVLHLPGQDVLAVSPSPGAEVLVPFVAAVVPEVDLRGGRLFVDPPPGLLDVPGADEAAP